MLHSRQYPRSETTTMRNVYEPKFSDRTIKWVVCFALAVAIAMAVVSVTAIIYG